MASNKKSRKSDGENTQVFKKQKFANVIVISDSEDESMEVLACKIPAAAFPHARCHCINPKFRFGVSRELNLKYCDQCYCFVCDSLARQCGFWKRHCDASDKDPEWIAKRKQYRLNQSLKEAIMTRKAFITIDKENARVPEISDQEWIRLPGHMDFLFPISVQCVPQAKGRDFNAQDLFIMCKAHCSAALSVTERAKELATLELQDLLRIFASETSETGSVKTLRVQVHVSKAKLGLLESPLCPREMHGIMTELLFSLRLSLALQKRLNDAMFSGFPETSESAEQQAVFSLESVLKALEMNTNDWPSIDRDPPGLKLTLRPYQKQSVRWMLDRENAEYGMVEHLWVQLANANPPLLYCPLANRFGKMKARHSRGGFLCEEMGLGKTIETLSLILLNPLPKDEQTIGCCSEAKSERLKRSRATLIVCPVTLLEQWRTEVEKSTEPRTLKLLFWHGKDRKKSDAFIADHDIVLTSYSLLSSPGPLMKIAWHRVILDESQVIRSTGRQVSDTCRRLHSHLRWCVTGTPFNTKSYDVVGQLNFLHMDPLGDMTTFDKCIGRFFDSQQPGGDARLKALLRMMMVRHSKKQVFAGQKLVDLPALYVQTIPIDMSADMQVLYQHVHSYAQRCYKQVTEHYLRPSSVLLMDILYPCRQLCSHPAIVKEVRLRRAAGPVVLPLPSRRKKAEKEGETEEPPADPELPQVLLRVWEKLKKAEAPKIQFFLQCLKEIREDDTDAKVVVFSAFNETLDLLGDALTRNKIKFVCVEGSKDQKKRAQALQQFQTDPSVTVFLLGVRVGAVGLTLTAANHCFIFDPCLDPAMEDQAIGRVHRIGQQKPVFVKRLVFRDTIEERMEVLMQQWRKSRPQNTSATNSASDTDHAEPADNGAESEAESVDDDAEGAGEGRKAGERSGEAVDKRPCMSVRMSSHELSVLFDPLPSSRSNQKHS